MSLGILLHLSHSFIFVFSGFVQLLLTSLIAGILFEPLTQKLHWEVWLDLNEFSEPSDKHVLEGRLFDLFDWVIFFARHLYFSVILSCNYILLQLI